MEIIDNINHLLGDNLKQTLKPGPKLKPALCFGADSLRSRSEAGDFFYIEMSNIFARKMPASEKSARCAISMKTDIGDLPMIGRTIEYTAI
jgi:hypothetical protein